MRSAFLLLAFFILSAKSFISAQQLATVYSVEEGLPQSTVTSLYRDNSGYLWVGTGDGLAVFDGYNFRQFRKGVNGSNSLLNSTIRGIIPSSDSSSIWVGSEGGMHQFDRYSLRLLRSFDLFDDPGISQRPLFSNDTALWCIVSNKGLCRIRIKDSAVFPVVAIPFYGASTESGYDDLFAYTDNDDRLVVANLFSGNYHSLFLPNQLKSSDVTCIRWNPLDNDQLILLSRKGLYLVQLSTGLILPFSLGDKSYDERGKAFASMAVHPDGSWWIGVTGEGLMRYEPDSKQVRFCNWQQDGTSMSKVMYSPNSLICDQFGVIWYGTNGQGLVKCLHGKVRFRSKYNDALVTDTCNWFVRCFFEFNNGNYLVGTHGRGIFLVDNINQKVVPYSSGSIWNETTPLFIESVSGGKLLIGTDRSLLILDTVSQEVTRLDVAGLDSPKFKSCLRLSDHRLLVYGDFGIREFDETVAELIIEPFANTDMNVSYVFQMGNGNILAASVYSGLRMISALGELIRVYDYKTEIGIESATIIRGIVETQTGEIVLGTNSGLLLLDKRLRLIKSIGVQEGLPDNTVYGICKLGLTSFIVTTGHGIAIWETEKNSFSSFYSRDGLPSDECNSGALLFSKNSWLYIGTISGFIRWRPEEIIQNIFWSSRIMVSFVNSEGQLELIRHSIEREYDSGPLDLFIWQSDFSFSKGNVLNYYLSGSVKELLRQTTLHELHFVSLESGNYVFFAGLSTLGSPPGSIRDLFSIVVFPPYWETTWFLCIVALGSVLLIALLSYFLFRANYMKKLRAFKMQQELDEIRQRISSDIHDEIGAGLTKIALGGDIMALRISNDNVAKEKFKWISKTARELSQSMKEVVWSVNPHYDSLDHMVAYFRAHASDFCDSTGLCFTFKGAEQYASSKVQPEVRRNLLLILKECLNNLSKHSGATQVELEMKVADDWLSMQIKDNGSGFDLGKLGGKNSNGLRNMHQRAEALSFSFLVQTSDLEGGCIVLVQGSLK